MNDSYDELPQPTSAPADTSLPDPTVALLEAGFAALGLRPELLTALADLGYEEPTPIQRETIPHLIAGRDLLGQAATGTARRRRSPSRHCSASTPVAAPSRRCSYWCRRASWRCR